MNDLWIDIRYTLRSLRKQPAFAAIVIATLAIGIGFSAAIFALVDAALFRPLGYEHEERVVSIGSMWSGGFDHSSVSIPEYLDYRDRARSFDAIAAWRQTSVNMTSGSGDPENLQAALVTSEFLDVLGVTVGRGRGLERGDDVPGAEPVVVLGHGLWSRRFGAQDAIVGSTIGIDGESYRVIGIMPRLMRFPTEVELWTTLRIDEADPGSRGAHNRHAIARLAPGVSLERAQEEMSSMAIALAEEHPEFYPEGSGWGISLRTLRELLIGDVRDPLLILMAAVAVLVLIAGANVANLMLARIWRRRDEMATRVALGAGRWRLLRQVLTESVVLGLAGGVAGAWIASFGAPLLVAIAPESVRRIGEIGLDWRVAVFTIAIAIAVSLVFGLITGAAMPNAGARRLTLTGGRSTATSGVKKALIVGEVALAFLLLIGAGLLVRTFVNLMSTDPGLRAEDVVTARISLSRERYSNDEERARFFDTLLERLESRPDVEQAGAVSLLPLGGSDTDYGFGVEGWRGPTPDSNPFEQARVVTPGYFETLGIPVRRGRAFSTRDSTDSSPVVMVSASFAARYWPDDDPIGKRIKLWGLEAEGQPWRTVVGVAGDVRHFGLDSEAPPILYFPLAQLGQRSMSIVARTSIDVPPLLIGDAVREIDSEQAIYAAATMESVIGDSLATPRLNLALLGVFAAVAVVLAAIGIYGVLSFLVSQSVREIGIRLALGATPSNIQHVVMRDGMKLVLGGMLVGAIASFGLSSILGRLLYEVSPVDPATWLGITALVLGIAIVACWRPAVRATRIDPSIALRQ